MKLLVKPKPSLIQWSQIQQKKILLVVTARPQSHRTNARYKRIPWNMYSKGINHYIHVKSHLFLSSSQQKRWNKQQIGRTKNILIANLDYIEKSILNKRDSPNLTQWSQIPHRNAVYIYIPYIVTYHILFFRVFIIPLTTSFIQLGTWVWLDVHLVLVTKLSSFRLICTKIFYSQIY